MPHPTVLVTGASGLVGRHIAGALAAAGANVVAVARHAPASDTPAAAGTSLSRPPKWLAADLLDSDRHAELLARADADILLLGAWVTAHGDFWSSPLNVDWQQATTDLVRAAAAAGVRRIVGIGTCVEYGATAPAHLREDMAINAPHTAYGRAKNATHQALARIASAAGLSFAWARLFHVSGAGEPSAKLLSHIVAERLHRRQPLIREPDRHLDLIDSRDAGAALAMLTLGNAEGAVNIASGRACRVGDLDRLAASVLARRYRDDTSEVSGEERVTLPEQHPPFSGLIADVSRMTGEIGYTPRHEPADTIRAIATAMADA